MGYAISRLLSINTMAESFMITYLSRQGITPYTMDLIPGGSLRDGDDANVRRHKFKMALKRQRQLGNALRQIERGLYRCQSPCFVRVFDEELEVDVNENTVVNEFKWMRGEGDEGRTRLNRRQSRNGFGALERLVSDTGRRDSIQIGGVAVSSEEIVAYDVVREQKVAKPLRGSQKEKRSRSRPEPRMRKAAGVPGAGKRQSMSVTHVVLREPEPHLLPPLICSLSRAVERIQLGCLKKARKAWPSSDAVRNVLKDPT